MRLRESHRLLRLSGTSALERHARPVQVEFPERAEVPGHLLRLCQGRGPGGLPGHVHWRVLGWGPSTACMEGPLCEDLDGLIPDLLPEGGDLPRAVH